MNPISRLRTRARSQAFSSATSRPLSAYDPFVGESSRPRIDSNVDLPHPDGPEIDTYSPRAISMLMSSSACVSTSSVTNTFVSRSSLITGGRPRSFKGALLLKSDAIERIPVGHIRENHLIAGVQPRADFDDVDRRGAELHLHARCTTVRLYFEQADRALFLPERRPTDEQHVVEPLEFDGAVHAQVRTRAFRQRFRHRHVDGDRAVLHRRIDANDFARDDADARVDGRGLSWQDVFRLRLGDFELGLEPRWIGDARQVRTGCDLLSDVHRHQLQHPGKAGVNVEIVHLLL